MPVYWPQPLQSTAQPAPAPHSPLLVQSQYGSMALAGVGFTIMNAE
ncbi:MAG: hypothetical protein ABSG65_23055 [Bryobacteraceae bacterium]